MKMFARILLFVALACSCRGTVIYQNNFDSPASLNGFTVGQVGSGRVLLDGGQLRINPGPTYLNRGFAALNVSQVAPSYKSVLSSNPGMITWAFNVSNMNGGMNNLVTFGIFSSADGSDSRGFGYQFGAGGYVADRMMLYQNALSSSPYGPVYDIMVDTSDGLSVLPQVGAVKITYEPELGRWSLYFEQHTSSVDPLSITGLVGTSINTGFTSASLPYVYFASQEPGSAFIDNFSISVIPEPATGSLLLVGILVLSGSLRNKR